MNGAITPLLQYALMAWLSVKAQGQLYLYISSSSSSSSSLFITVLPETNRKHFHASLERYFKKEATFRSLVMSEREREREQLQTSLSFIVHLSF
jgi:hypothetical protein